MSVGNYSTIEETGIAEIVEKKSRFICEVRHVESEEDIALFYDEIKKKYWDARHNCTASILGIEQPVMRSSDDGEPSGTAGKPILEVLIGNNLTNVAAVVTRYFGGTLLGTGGLVRAYGGVLSEALKEAKIVTFAPGVRYEVIADYSNFGKIKNFTIAQNIELTEVVYADNVKGILNIPAERVDEIITKITDMTGATVTLNKIDECRIRV